MRQQSWELLEFSCLKCSVEASGEGFPIGSQSKISNNLKIRNQSKLNSNFTKDEFFAKFKIRAKVTEGAWIKLILRDERFSNEFSTPTVPFHSYQPYSSKERYQQCFKTLHDCRLKQPTFIGQLSNILLLMQEARLYDAAYNEGPDCSSFPFPVPFSIYFPLTLRNPCSAV